MIAAPLVPAAETIAIVTTLDPRKRFPRSARVRTRAEYGAVFDAARRCSDPLFTLHWRRGQAPARVGMAVSRKVDTRAVVRNRIKRVVRETFRPLLPALPGGDYVLVARSAAAAASNERLRQALLGLLRRAGALPPPDGGVTMPAPARGDFPSLSMPDPPAG